MIYFCRWHPVRILLNTVIWGVLDCKWAGENAFLANIIIKNLFCNFLRIFQIISKGYVL